MRCHLLFSLFVYLLTFAVLPGLSPFLQAQDNASAKESAIDSGETDASDDESRDDDTFVAIYKDYTELDEQLTKLEADYNSETDPDARNSIKQEYTDLLEDARDVAAKLRKAAVVAFEASPNADETVSKTLIGVINNDLAFARIDEALELADKLISNDMKSDMFEALRDSTRLTTDDLQAVEEIILRSEENEQDDLPRVKLETSKGDVVIELFEDQAPGTVGNFVSLVEDGFYDGLTFHRVLDGFMAQGGDPKGDGTGDPGYKIKGETDASDARNHFRGSLSMANSGRPDTGGSQFFICFTRTHQLNGKHTVFGRVIEGMDVVDQFKRRDPGSADAAKITPDKIKKAEVIRKRDHKYEPVKAE